MKFKKEKVIVTGAAGFLGSHTVDELCRRGYEVHGVDDFSTGKTDNLFDVFEKHDIGFSTCDVNDYQRFKRVVSEVKPDYIFHYAAVVGVKKTLDQPLSVLDDIKGFENVCSLASKYDVKRLLYSSCLDENTRVSTPKGIKTHSELKKGDFVFSVNPKTKQFERKKIKKIIAQPYKGDMYEFKGKRFNINVTPNHKMLIDSGKESLFFEEAQLSNKRNTFKLPFCSQFEGKREEWFVFPKTKKRHWNTRKDPEKIKMKDLFYLMGVYIGDGYSDCHTTKKLAKSSLTAREYINTCRGSNGKFIKAPHTKKSYNTCKSYRVHFSVPDSDPARKKLMKVLLRCGYNPSEYPIDVYLSSEKLYNLFNECTHSALTKQVPEWMWEYDSEYLRELWKGLIDSDGSWKSSPNPNSAVLSTSSKKLAEQCVELAFKIGKYVCISERQPRTSFIKGRKVNAKLGYQVYFSSTEPSVRPPNKSINGYEGVVWCLEVEDNHNFLIEKNGKFAFTGNSSEVYGDPVEVPLNEETSPLNAQLPYAVVKNVGEKFLESYQQEKGLDFTIFRFFNCYDEKTEILTDEGWKLFKDLNKTEKVATLNPKTNQIVFQKPVAYQILKHKGRMIHIKNKRLNLLVTPEHKLLVNMRDPTSPKQFELVSAENLKRNGKAFYQFKQNGIWKGKQKNIKQLKPITFDDGTGRKKTHEPIPMKVWVQFMGWFLSEGCVFKSSSGVYTIVITQKDAKQVKDIKKIIEKMGFKTYTQINERGISQIKIHSKVLYNELKKFKGIKYIPRELLELDSTFLVELFKTLMFGDGDKTGRRYSTKYKDFADDFQELLLKIGKIGRITEEHNGVFKIFRIYINKNPYPRIGDYKQQKLYLNEINYEGKVYDVTVPEFHTLFVRRKGIPLWSGNCYGTRQRTDFVVSKFIKQAKQGKDITVYGDGEQYRTFMHVQDNVDACCNALLSDKHINQTYNVGGTEKISINDLAEIIIKATKSNSKVVHLPALEKGDMPIRAPDITKMNKLIDTSKLLSFEKGLELTVERMFDNGD